MLDTVIEYVAANYGAPETAYKGPNGDGELDGRVSRNGSDTYNHLRSEVLPLTILHHNDSHGYLTDSGSRPGYPRLVTLINQARAHDPDHTLLLHAGDAIQGDAMSYFFKSAGLGYSADGTELPADLQIQPLIKAFNYVGYDGFTIGNHEYNFGKDIFKSVLGSAAFPVLQANIVDDGSYGIEDVNVEPYIIKTVGSENIPVAILGIGNHRVVNYELPSNIPGLSFPNPIDTAKALMSEKDVIDSDVVVALTHIGFTEDPDSIEVDENVDTNLAYQVDGIDAIVGGHSHTNPAYGFGDYKYLPAIVPSQGGTPTIIGQAYRYNNTLGQLVLGLLPDEDAALQADGIQAVEKYKVVSRAGRYESVTIAGASEDPIVKAIIQPYVDLLDNYRNTTLGETIIPIDTLEAFTQETNGANLQADAAVWKLEKETDVDVDFHLSGAMTNALIAETATPDTPYMLKIADMFTAMPYENSLVVLKMNGPQLKAVLERAYRNYYYYKYVPGYGGYSHYPTCMLDINAGGKITYNDTAPELPSGNNVISLEFDGKSVDFKDADTYYNVSTVNYLAAGSCNFNDDGVSLWPIDEESIAADTQYYVRDSVSEYIQYLVEETGEPINPQIEGRLQFLTLDKRLWMPVLFK